MGLFITVRDRLPLVGLSEGCRFSLFRHQLPGRTHGLHQNSFVLGSVTDYDAQLAPLAAIDVDFRHHLGRVEIEAVRLGTIHDAEATAFLGCTFFVDDLRDVIHYSSFPFLRGNGRIADLQLNLVLFGPFACDLVGTLHGRKILSEQHFFLREFLLDRFVERGSAA